MEMIKVAVAMSVYKSDIAEYLEQSLESIFGQVNVQPYVFLQVDGIVSNEVKNVISKYAANQKLFPTWYKDNAGLATRLNDAIKIVLEEKYDFLARMDADDICYPERFKKQVEFLEINKSVSVVGSDVIEFSDSGDDTFYKKMVASHDDIAKKIIKKCPFNHPSVMFRMSVFEEGFRYKSELMNTQDYYLWVDLLAAGKKFANINEPLLKFRVNDSFHSRRGFKKAMNDLNSRIYAFKKLNVLNVGNVIHTINLFLLRIAPTSVKKWAYKTLR